MSDYHCPGCKDTGEVDEDHGNGAVERMGCHFCYGLAPVMVERDAAITRAEKAEARVAEDDALIDRVGYCHACAVELAEEPGDRPPSVTCYDCACDHRLEIEVRLDAVRALELRCRREGRYCTPDELKAAIGGEG